MQHKNATIDHILPASPRKGRRGVFGTTAFQSAMSCFALHSKLFLKDSSNTNSAFRNKHKQHDVYAVHTQHTEMPPHWILG